MALPRLGRSSETLNPFHVAEDGSHLLGAFSQFGKIGIQRAVAEERAQGVDAVAQALEYVVKLGTADDLPVGAQECGRKKSNGEPRELRVVRRIVLAAERDAGEDAGATLAGEKFLTAAFDPFVRP